MKRIVLMAMAILGMGCMVSCMARKVSDNDITETRKVEDFSSIRIDGMASVYFTQGDDYSFRIEGDETLVRLTEANVQGNTLVIDQRKKKFDNLRVVHGVSIYVTAPSLERVEFDGVGSFYCQKRLNADDIRFDVDGVGKVKVADLHCNSLRVNIDGVGKTNIHMDCRDLDADIDGVGKMVLSGKADYARIRKDGFGSCNTRNLEIGTIED